MLRLIFGKIPLLMRFYRWMLNILQTWILGGKSLTAELHWQYSDDQNSSFTMLVLSTKCWQGINLPYTTTTTRAGGVSPHKKTRQIFLHRKSKHHPHFYCVSPQKSCDTDDKFHISDNDKGRFYIPNTDEWVSFLTGARALYLLDLERNKFYIGSEGLNYIKDRMKQEILLPHKQ